MKTNTSAIMLSAFSFFLASFFDKRSVTSDDDSDSLIDFIDSPHVRHKIETSFIFLLSLNASCIARYAHSFFKEIYSKIIQKSSQLTTNREA